MEHVQEATMSSAAGAKDGKPRVISFFQSEKCFVKKSESRTTTLTHTLLNGGSVRVEDPQLDQFFNAYGEDLRDKRSLFIVERKSDVFKLHFDCDFKTTPSDEYLSNFVDTTCRTVQTYFSGDSHTASCIVCAVLGDDGKSRKAPGLHLVFPHAHVDETAALWIRAGVVHALMRMEGRSGDEDWNSIVDICVLTTAGLRMVGSDKCKQCPQCRNVTENRVYCGSCDQKGYVVENKIYWPHSAWPTGDDSIQYDLNCVRENPAYAVKLCSTRLRAQAKISDTFAVPVGAPPISAKKRKKGEADAYSLECGASDLPHARNATRIRLEPNAHDALLRAIREYLPQYERVDIKDIDEIKNNKGVTLRVRVFGFGSRFCLNKNAEHSSQSIYFVVSPLNGISQRCYSRKNVERCDGVCEHFKSAPKPLHNSLTTLLFPGFQVKSSKRAPPTIYSRNITGSREEADQLQLQIARTAAVVCTISPDAIVMRNSSSSQSVSSLAAAPPSLLW